WRASTSCAAAISARSSGDAASVRGAASFSRVAARLFRSATSGGRRVRPQQRAHRLLRGVDDLVGLEDHFGTGVMQPGVDATNLAVEPPDVFRQAVDRVRYPID